MAADRPSKVSKTDEEWKMHLTPEQYHVTRQHGTERAFSNALNNEKRKGMFNCVCCGAPLFSSDTKFDSGTGWPSFWAPTDKNAVLSKLKEAVGKCNAAYGSGSAQLKPLFVNVGHTNLHYGNIITYMRMMGLKPPSS